MNNLFDVEIADIVHETDEIRRFILAPLTTCPLPAFHPGAHITTTMAYKGQTIHRTYSLCGDIFHTDTYQIAVRKLSEEGGSGLWHQLPKGHKLRISAPHSNFPLNPRARHHVLVAGGIGITPFLPMMQSLQTTGKSFELHFAAKSRAACAFYDHIQTNHPGQSFYFSADPLRDHGQRLTPSVLASQKIGTHVYICGPVSLIETFQEAAQRLGYPHANVHVERFRSHQIKNRAFQVYLQKQAYGFEVKEDESLLEALEKRGLNIPYSCRAGGCGTCKVRVIAGDVLHQDDYWTEAERVNGETMLACVSRAHSPLVIDL